MAGYVHIVFPFQTRSRVEYKLTENKVLNWKDSAQSRYFLHLMKSTFVWRHFLCFDCQLRILLFAIWLLFLLVYFLECGSKCPVNEAKIRLLYGYMACDLRLFAHSSYSYTEQKYIKELWRGFRSKPARYLMLFDRIFQLCMHTLMTLSCIFHFVPILLTIRPLPLPQWNTA